MAIQVNVDAVPPQPCGVAATRRPLLTRELVPGTNILLEQIDLSPAGSLEVDIAASDIGWFQMLSGRLAYTCSGDQRRTEAGEIDQSHLVFLPAGCQTTLRSAGGASLLLARVPGAHRFDSSFSAASTAFRTVDWQREPVLDSQHDARQRIYLVTPKLFGTKVLKGEMIIYPPGTMAANHHHEGAEHFMYMLRGRGTAWANEQPFQVKAGDLVYYHDKERHYLKADDDSELVFSEFFVPGEYRTIWVNEGEVCTWLPTGRDIKGNRPVREIAAHSSADVASPADV